MLRSANPLACCAVATDVSGRHKLMTTSQELGAIVSTYCDKLVAQLVGAAQLVDALTKAMAQQPVLTGCNDEPEPAPVDPGLQAKLDQVTAERDELAVKLVEYQLTSKSAADRVAKLERERDDARAARDAAELNEAAANEHRQIGDELLAGWIVAGEQHKRQLAQVQAQYEAFATEVKRLVKAGYIPALQALLDADAAGPLTGSGLQVDDRTATGRKAI